MHAVPGPNAEEEADRFASEFLMPEREIAPDLGDLNLAKAVRLKGQWRVSAQAVIRRAKDVGKISGRQYSALYAQLSQEGYRREEPMPLAPESPTVVRDLVEVYRSSFEYDIPQLCRYVFSTERSFRELFLGESPAQLT
jgi:Zn-dependent peptidase ImmA (M78 family)